MRIAKFAISIMVIASIAAGCTYRSAQPEPSAGAGSIATGIYKEISASIVYIDTPTGTGSGIYIEGGYILTCAHVAWPFETVRAVFPSGSEYDVDVLNSDVIADIAVLGPVTDEAPQLALSSDADPSIGDTVFIVGYPGEDDEYPHPALSQGLVSRLRSWTSQGLRYIQTDAAASGGASGGALVSASGEVIAMMGFTYADVFGLGVSAADMYQRVLRLIGGEDVSGLGPRQLPLSGGETSQEVTLQNCMDSRIFIINEPDGTTVDIEGTSDEDIALYLFDAGSYELAESDDGLSGSESLSAETDYGAPCFLIVRQFSDSEADVELTASCNLIPFNDADDGLTIGPGQAIAGSLDCPGDSDYYVMDLEASQTVTITVDSIAIDAYIEVAAFQDWDEDDWYDDDSGGGLFGTNAQLEFTAPQSGRYYISVSDYNDEWSGGYILSVE